jgi:hypothetical protein
MDDGTPISHLPSHADVDRSQARLEEEVDQLTTQLIDAQQRCERTLREKASAEETLHQLSLSHTPSAVQDMLSKATDMVSTHEPPPPAPSCSYPRRPTQLGLFKAVAERSMWRRLVVGEQVGRAEAERDESAAQLELSRCAVIMATPWPHHGHTMATPWPHHGHAMATPWPHHGHTMATPTRWCRRYIDASTGGLSIP